jgi:hypothetical protein
MSKQTKDWMERLVENYRVPTEEEVKQKTQKKKVLKESQIKRILERD